MNNSDQIPVVIFVYKRLDTLKSVIASLLENEEAPTTDLIFISDGPKNSAESTRVDEVRRYILDLKGFQSVKLESNEINLGLANSFLSGVTKIFLNYDKAIFLEDDNYVSKNFLFYMKSALLKYENVVNVGCISGFSYPTPILKRKPYFLKGAETWSFATWKRVWSSFETDPSKLKSEIDRSSKKRDLNMYGFDFYKMLGMQIAGEIDSWGVRWWSNAVCKDLLCLYPAKPHCVNIGWGLDGTHIQSKTRMLSSVSKLETKRDSVWLNKIRPSKSMHAYLRMFNAKEKIKSIIYIALTSSNRKL